MGEPEWIAIRPKSVYVSSDCLGRIAVQDARGSKAALMLRTFIMGELLINNLCGDMVVGC